MRLRKFEWDKENKRNTLYLREGYERKKVGVLLEVDDGDFSLIFKAIVERGRTFYDMTEKGAMRRAEEYIEKVYDYALEYDKKLLERSIARIKRGVSLANEKPEENKEAIEELKFILEVLEEKNNEV